MRISRCSDLIPNPAGGGAPGFAGVWESGSESGSESESGSRAESFWRKNRRNNKAGFQPETTLSADLRRPARALPPPKTRRGADADSCWLCNALLPSDF